MNNISRFTCDEIGIQTVELLPRPGDADIKDRLTRSIAQAQIMRAAVAYWTVGPDDVCPLLATRLSRPKSFLCIDVHFPTDLDQVSLLDGRGANVYLHLRHLSIGTETINRGLPRHLMHTKLLLFDLDDDTAEIWTGSHNWTLRALGGPNVEASLVLQVSRDSAIYADTVATLESIRDLCHRFQRSELELYKQLQWQQKDENQDELVPVIELEGRHAAHIKGAIALFGASGEDWESNWHDLRSIEQMVKLEVTDSETGKVFLYDALILHSGLQPAAHPNAGGIAFSKRRYAIIDDNTRRPVLQLAAKPRDELLAESAYFVTLQVQRQLTQMTLAEPEPNDRRWITIKEDPLLRRMRPDHYNLIVAHRHRRLSMQVPAFLAGSRRIMEEHTIQGLLFEPNDQLTLRRHRLIAWKIAKDTDIQEA